jgi:hypothetical protein
MNPEPCQPDRPTERLLCVTSNTRPAKVAVPRLTKRLVDPNSMAQGLEELLSGLSRFTLIIKRPGFSWELARFQSTEVVLFEDEKVVNDGRIDPRILRGKQVTLIATSSDRGTASIDLTFRQIQIWASTAELRDLIAAFNAHLLRGARSRWFTPRAIAALVFTPIAAIIALPLIDLAVNPKVRNAANANSKSVPWDQWTFRVALVSVLIWLFLILAAVAIGGIRARSGPLRIWPGSLTLRSFAQTVGKIRINVALRNNVNSIVVGVITALLVLVLSRLF